jgi:putative monooxygenase
VTTVTSISGTKVALRDVAPTRRQGGEVRVLLTPRSVGATAGFLGTLALAPGEHVARHYHPYSEEFLYLVRGRLVVQVDGERVELGPDESLLIPRGARHRLEGAGDEPSFAVFSIGPLAPRPELGHVDLELPVNPSEPLPRVGGTGRA